MSEAQADGDSTLFRKLMMEEIDIILRENKERIVKKVHKRLRDMAKVGK